MIILIKKFILIKNRRHLYLDDETFEILYKFVDENKRRIDKLNLEGYDDAKCYADICMSEYLFQPFKVSFEGLDEEELAYNMTRNIIDSVLASFSC